MGRSDLKHAAAPGGTEPLSWSCCRRIILRHGHLGDIGWWLVVIPGWNMTNFLIESSPPLGFRNDWKNGEPWAFTGHWHLVCGVHLCWDLSGESLQKSASQLLQSTHWGRAFGYARGNPHTGKIRCPNYCRYFGISLFSWGHPKPSHPWPPRFWKVSFSAVACLSLSVMPG